MSRARWSAAVLPLGGLLLAGGCAAPPRFLAETFDGPPRSLSAFQGEDRWGPAKIPAARSRTDIPADGAGVLNGRLLAGGTRILRAEFPFHDFQGACDFMAAGGILDGSAGIFVEERRPGAAAASRPSHYTLALNGRGEWRAYRGLPGRPLGVVAWKPLPDPNPAVPRILGVEAASGVVRFLVDGKEVASFGGPPGEADSPSAGENGPGAARPAERRVGLFAEQLQGSFDNFIFREAGADEPEGLRAAAPGGPPAEGDRLTAEAAGRAEEFRARPTRAGLLEVIEARAAAERAFQAGDPARAESAAADTVNVLVSLEGPATQSRSDDLLRMAVRSRNLSPEAREALMGRSVESYSRRAREAGAAKRPIEALVFWLAAGEVDRTPEVERQVKEIGGVLEPPLTFSYALRQESATAGEFSRQIFYSAARSIYGALPEKKDGEIKVEVVVKEARLSEEVEESMRKVPRSAPANPLPPAALTELARLEKTIPEDLRDAENRAKVARKIEFSAGNRFTMFEYRGRSVEVYDDDARALQRSSARLGYLRRRREAEKAAEGAFISVPAKLHTDSARVRLTYRLSCGVGVEAAGAIEVYEAIEQWTHPADPASGIEASAWSKSERDRMVDSVRNRAVSRLRNGIARECALSKLGKDDATRFLVRFARSTGDHEDRSEVEWRLKSVYGLDGILLERVVARLLEPRGVS